MSVGRASQPPHLAGYYCHATYDRCDAGTFGVYLLTMMVSGGHTHDEAAVPQHHEIIRITHLLAMHTVTGIAIHFTAAVTVPLA